MNKKLHYFISVLICVFACIQSNASDFNAVCPSGQTLYYNIISAVDHTVSVTYPGTGYPYWTGYTQPSGNITIPSYVNYGGQTYTVTQLGNNVFCECSSITGITIPNTITHIGIGACALCSITSITIPNSVNHIESIAFFGNPCTSITIVNQNVAMDYGVFQDTPWYDSQPNGLVYIGSILYEYKGNAPANTALSISPTTTSIAGKAFYGQNGITSINLPNTLKSIGEHAFFSCGGITTITIPFSVEIIADKAFENCGSLATVNWNAINCSIYSPLYRYTSGIFRGCDNFSTLNIGNGVIGIPEYAFCSCSHLSGTLSFPTSLTTIGQHAFYECSALTTLSIPESVNYIGQSAFYGCSALSTINYNAINCDSDSYSSPFTNCNSISTIIIGNSVQIIPSKMFYSTNITSLTIPASVTFIGNSAFAYSTSLNTLAFNATNCQTSGSHPFYGCSSLVNVTFGSDVHYIPDGLFSNALTATVGTISLPNSITYIGKYAFYNCTGISGTLAIPNGVSKIKTYSFYGCSGLTNIIVPNSVSVIDTMAFANCSNVTQITLGTAVDTIRTFAMTGLTSLSTINWNSINCRSNPNALFNGNSITTLNIGSTVQTIPDNLITGCQNLSSVSFPNSLTRIGTFNFLSCGLSGAIHLPSSLTQIGYGAFGGCSGITSVQCDAIIPPSVEPMNGYCIAFSNYENPLYVPCGSVSAYQNALGWSFFTDILEMGDCTHQISVLANPSNCGSVSGGGTYNSGSNCIVTATPNSNYSFVNWTENGTPVSSNTSYSFVVNDDRILTANFQYQQPSTFTINAAANPANGGTISGTGIYTQGQTCTLIVSANSAFVFLNWTENGDVVSTDANYSFTVNGNRTLIANFYYDAIEEFANSIVINPNPTKGFVRIETEDLKHITINNMFGQIIYDCKASGNEFAYDFSRYEAGVYLIRIETAIGMATKRVVVTR